MDKITIKELAPYLPYGLKCIWNTETYELHGVLANDKCKLMDIYDDTIYGCGIKFIKPLLLPLSNLIKEIEVNGERFVPAITLSASTMLLYDILINNPTLDLFSAPYYDIEKLFQWHFDVFGLIERGLAIDKTTINNV